MNQNIPSTNLSPKPKKQEVLSLGEFLKKNPFRIALSLTKLEDCRDRIDLLSTITATCCSTIQLDDTTIVFKTYQDIHRFKNRLKQIGPYREPVITLRSPADTARLKQGIKKEVKRRVKPRRLFSGLSLVRSSWNKELYVGFLNIAQLPVLEAVCNSYHKHFEANEFYFAVKIPSKTEKIFILLYFSFADGIASCRAHTFSNAGTNILVTSCIEQWQSTNFFYTYQSTSTIFKKKLVAQIIRQINCIANPTENRSKTPLLDFVGSVISYRETAEDFIESYKVTKHKTVIKKPEPRLVPIKKPSALRRLSNCLFSCYC